MLATLPLLEPSQFPKIRRKQLQILQVNLGYRCNQQCLHCHVNAGPKRSETMSDETATQVKMFFQQHPIKVLDLTGGAPELNPVFRDLVMTAKAQGLAVIDRCNLTILSESGQEDLAVFLAQHQVEIIASLPCYLEENVDKQRGKGVFEQSVAGLKQLNALGYGKDPKLKLNLMYNPIDPILPPTQTVLEADYKAKLKQLGIAFNHLYTLTNMPIQRFGSALISKGQFHPYIALLKSAYQSENLKSVMCRTLISVDWLGYVYDCDFNQMLDLPLQWQQQAKVHLTDLMNTDLTQNPICVADHCYGCTAGEGSSCGGALS